MESLSELMPSGGEPVAYEKETFGSSPELIKGGRRRKSRGKKSGKKSRKSRRIRKKTRGGNNMPKPMGAGNMVGGKSKSRRRKRGGALGRHSSSGPGYGHN